MIILSNLIQNWFDLSFVMVFWYKNERYGIFWRSCCFVGVLELEKVPFELKSGSGSLFFGWVFPDFDTFKPALFSCD